MPFVFTMTSHDDARAKARYDENIRAFAAFENPRHDDDLEPVINPVVEALLAELDDIAAMDLDTLRATPTSQPVPITASWSTISTTPVTPNSARFVQTVEELDRIDAMKQPIEPAYSSPYDTAVYERHDLEQRLETLPQHMEHLRPVLLKQLDAVNAKVRIELDRSTDDAWRRRRGADEWRAENADAYNASRRTKRAAPNTVTPKAILATETEEQKRARLLAQKAARKAASIASESPEQAAERKAKDAARKAAKRAEKKLA